MSLLLINAIIKTVCMFGFLIVMLLALFNGDWPAVERFLILCLLFEISARQILCELSKE